MSLSSDIQHIGRLLASAADTEIMPRFRSLTAAGVREKTSTFDVVTEADEAAEHVIAQGLKAAFPRAAVIGEEAAGRDGGLLGLLYGLQLLQLPAQLSKICQILRGTVYTGMSLSLI